MTPATAEYANPGPTRAEIDALPGPTLLEFGVPWCPHCQAAQPIIKAALERKPNVRYLKVEDGEGRALGRSFQVKLWPSLIFLKDGHEVSRVVRPLSREPLDQALVQITANP